MINKYMNLRHEEHSEKLDAKPKLVPRIKVETWDWNTYGIGNESRLY